MDNETKELIQSLKSQVEENEGELAYWGEPLTLKPAPIAPTKAHRLEAYRQETIGDCRLCPLWETRKKIVFGVGNPESKVMFVGEGPGFDEDRIGEPFVGKAGQLLDKIMASIGLNRTNAYIANIVKCHPMVDPSQPDKRGNDRAPAPSEIETCLPFLKEQISIIQPSIIVALGGVAAKTLLSRTDGITRLRGQIFHVELNAGSPLFRVLPTFHPAALLRDETLKKLVWEDMKTLRNLLNSENGM